MVTETRISRSSDPCTYHSSWPVSLILTSSCSLSCALFCKFLSSLLPTDWVPASIVLCGTICYSTRELHRAIATMSKETSILCSLLALLSCGCGYGHGDLASRLRVLTVLCADIRFCSAEDFLISTRGSPSGEIWHSTTPISRRICDHKGISYSITMELCYVNMLLLLCMYSWWFLNVMFLLCFSIGKTVLIAFISWRMYDFLRQVKMM